MSDIKFFSRCENCHKRKLIIKKRAVVLPRGLTALSRKLLCSKCQRSVQKAVNPNGFN